MLCSLLLSSFFPDFLLKSTSLPEMLFIISNDTDNHNDYSNGYINTVGGVENVQQYHGLSLLVVAFLPIVTPVTPENAPLVINLRDTASGRAGMRGC